MRNTVQGKKVRDVLKLHRVLYGYEIMDLTGLASGTVYPMLRRFVLAGDLLAHPEVGDPVELGRPLRTVYVCNF